MTPVVIHRRLEEDDFAGEAIGVSRSAAERLGFPSHSDEISIDLGGQEEAALWNARDRTIGGDAVVDFLFGDCRVGGLIRFVRDAEGVHLMDVSAVDGPTADPHPDIEIDEPDDNTEEPSRKARRRRGRQAGPPPVRTDTDFRWHGDVGVLTSSIKGVRDAIRGRRWESQELFDLRMRGESIAAVSGFEELVAAHLAKVDQKPHQYNVALKVLARMHGRAILADEVGLGKTIEAGLILKELFTRGLATRFLVICPATLREQWKGELHGKFDLESRVVTTGADSFGKDNLIISQELARRNIYKILRQRTRWDVVIVDEAHRGVRGKVNRALLSKLGSHARYVLYLTATPVQNSLLDLYWLVKDLRPETFESERDFRQRYCSRGVEQEPSDPEALRELLADVMVRTTRGQASPDQATRHVHDIGIPLSDTERREYDVLLDALRSLPPQAGDHLRRQRWAQRLLLSPRALALSLIRSSDARDAQPQLQRIVDNALDSQLSSRQEALVLLVRSWTADPGKGKVVVFCSQKDVAEDLIRLLRAAGLTAAPYFGSERVRTQSLEAFQGPTQVLVATDAGAEGLNLQFANCVVNYDLPWNPMRIEQRIGRVDRIGQDRDVHVANFVTPNTVEDRIYQVLHNKLRMFELLFGQITLVLGEIDDREGRSLETQILEAVFGDRPLNEAFDDIDEKAEQARGKARSLIAAQDELANWLPEGWDTSHRTDLSRSGAETLRPDISVGNTDRQRQLTDFVQDFLKRAGAEVVRQVESTDGDGDSRGLFLTASLPPPLIEPFGGVDRLHIAFHPSGLDLHPDSELCAVGTDLFDDVIAFVRQSGELVVKVPTLELDDQPLIPCAADLEYIGREVHGPTTWNVEGTWLAKLGGDSGAAKVFRVSDSKVPRVRRRTLDPGEDRPRTLKAGPVVTIAVDSAVGEIGAAAATESARAFELQSQDFHTTRESRLDRIEDLTRDLASSRDTVQRKEIETRLGNLRMLIERTPEPVPSTIKARIELLGLKVLGGPTVALVERWRTATGHEVELAFDYSVANHTFEADLGDDDIEISILAACDEGHTIDESSRRQCAECSSRHCDACARSAYHRCPGCGRDVCRKCWSKGLCAVCAHPARLEDVDGLATFQLAGDHVLTVGRRVALIDGVKVPGADTTDPRLVEAAQSLGLGPDSGLRGEFDLPHGAQRELTVALGVESTIELVVDENPNGTVDQSAVDRYFGLHDFASSEDDPRPSAALDQLIATIRNALDLPTTGLVARTTGRRSTLVLSGEPVIELLVRASDATVETSRQPLRWEQHPIDPRDARAVVARGQGHVDRGEVSVVVERLHRSHLLRVGLGGTPVGTIFVPWAEGVELADEVALATFADSLPRRLGHRLSWSHGRACPPPAGSTRAVLTDRTIEPFDDQTLQAAVRPLTIADLVEPSTPSDLPVVDAVGSPDELTQWLRDVDPPGGPVTPVGRWYRIREVWSGDGDAVWSYTTEGGTDPYGPRGIAGDFVVDRCGHFVGVGHNMTCPVCGLESCARCDGSAAVMPCASCGQSACGACCESSANQTSSPLAGAACVACETVLCGDCGRAQAASRCELCAQPLCGAHRGRCPSCSGPFAVVDPNELGQLTQRLGLAGHLVLAGEQGHRRTLVIAGGARREVVSVRDDGVVELWSSPLEPDRVRRLVGLAQIFGRPVTDPHTDVAPLTLDDRPDVLVREIVWRATFDRTLVECPAIVCEPEVNAPRIADVLIREAGVSTGLPPIEHRLQLEGPLSRVFDGVDVPHATTTTVRVRPTISELRIDAEEGIVLAESGPGGDRTDALLQDGEPLTEPVLGHTISVKSYGLGISVSVHDSQGSIVTRRVIGRSEAELTTSAVLERLRRRERLPEGRLMAGDLGDPVDLPFVQPLSEVVVTSTARLSGRTSSSRTTTKALSPELLPAEFSEALPTDDLEGDTRFVAAPTVVDDLLKQITDTVDVDITYKYEAVWLPRSRPLFTVTATGSTIPDPPSLTAPRSHGWDFVIDRSGHLVGPRGQVECPSCGKLSCSHCTGRAAVHRCSECRQTACGSCRKPSKRRRPQPTVARSRCADCSSTLCPACHRLQHSVACAICAVTVCRSCSVDGRCRSCAHIHPISPDDAPAGYNATGHIVHHGRSGPTETLTIVGGRRDEVIRIENGEPVWWLDYSGLTDREWRLIFAASAAGPVGGVSVNEISGPAAAEVLELVLNESVERDARLLAPDGSLVAQRADVRTDPSTELLQSISDSRFETVSHRSPSDRPPDLPDASVRAGSASIVITPSTRRTMITSSGIVVSTFRGGDLIQSECHPFEPASPTLVRSRPSPPAEVTAATVGEHRAVRLTYGELEFVTTDPLDPTRWTRIDRSPHDPRSVLLGQVLLKKPRAVTVAKAVEVRGLHFISIRNASLARRTYSFVVTPASVTVTEGLSAAEAMRRLAISYPSELFADRPPSLRPAGNTHRPAAFVDVGVNVTEVWTTPNGDLQVDYHVPGDTVVAQGIAFDTGNRVNRLFADRDGHLVEHVTTCPYCQEVNCDRCEVRVTPCAVCGIQVCGSCGSEIAAMRLCPACKAIRVDDGFADRVRRLAGSVHGAGADALHSVRVNVGRREGTVTVTVGNDVTVRPIGPDERGLLEVIFAGVDSAL